MDSKTEPASEAKERIEKESRPVSFKEYYQLYCNYVNHDETIRSQREEITRLKAELERERSKNSWNDALDEVQKLFKDYLLPITPSSDNIALIAEKVVEIYKEIETLKSKN